MKSRLRVLTPPAAAALAGAAALALILGPAPLHADWIVTRQGDRFEIQGTWQLKGKLLVFTLPNGTLSSLPAAPPDAQGTVRTPSQDILTEVNVVAALFDDSGTLIGRFPAVVDNQQLPPGESSKFHLVAGGVYAFAAIHWETTSKGFRSVQDVVGVAL